MPLAERIGSGAVVLAVTDNPILRNPIRPSRVEVCPPTWRAERRHPPVSSRYRFARRRDETAEILRFDRGPHVSGANCGLPSSVGNVIKDEANLLVASAELFRQRCAIEVRDLATGRI